MPGYEKKTAYINGTIYTADHRRSRAEAVVTVLDRIIFVGTTGDAREFIDPRTKVVDLKGALMLPGFTDSHAHIVMGGAYLLSVDLSKAKSTHEFKERLAEYCATKPAGWVTGGNWNHENWESNALPRKEWVDDFTQDIPIFVSRMDYHMALANSCALRLAGITRDTPDPVGGMIVRDERTGEPTGVVKDKAMDLVQAAIPTPTEEELDRAALAAMAEARRLGVTSIHDISITNDFRTLQRLEAAGQLTCRVYSRLPIDWTQALIDAEIQCGFGSDMLSIGSMKAFADGSLGSSTALFYEPYSDDSSLYGLAMDVVLDGRLEAWALAADRNRLQLSIHAIGDRANGMMLDLFDEIVRRNPAWDRRFRIEHAQHVIPGDFARFARLGVIVSAQPYHLYDDGAWAVRKIGPERLHGMYAFRSFLDAGITMCFGSDWPVVTLDPIAGMYAAVTRQTADGSHPDGLMPEEKLSVEEAVQCYTANGAFAAFKEGSLGTIEAGKKADLVVLTQDIFTIPPAQIKDVRVQATILNGDIVYGEL